MERLTRRLENGKISFRGRLPNFNYFADSLVGMDCYKEYCDALYRLAQYEDLEEQGRLLVLPCKLGDTLYDAYTGDIKHHYVTEFSTRGKDIDIQVNDFYAVGGCYSHASDIGKTVFLSREEAEKTLEGMK